MTNSGVAGWVVACVLAAILFGEAMATRSIFDRYKNQSEKNYRSDYYCPTKPRLIDGKPAAPSNPKGNEGSEKSEYELCQQWRAAEAAEEAAIVAWIQLPFSVVGIGLVILATVFSAKSARAATRAVETQIRIEQPFLVVQLLRLEGEDGDYGRVDIDLENIGKTPAVITAISTAASPSGLEVGTFRSLVPPILLLQGGKRPAPAFVHSDQAADMILSGQIPVHVAGRVLYEDALGRARSFGFAYRGQRNSNMSNHEGRHVFDWVRVGGPEYNYDREIKTNG